MNKVVIVTSYASTKLIQKYSDSNVALIGIERGIELIAKAGKTVSLGIGDFDTLPYEEATKYVSSKNIIRLNARKDESDTEAAVSYLQKLGVNEIVILASLQGRYDHSHALLLLTKKFASCKVTIEDDNNLISYLGKGNYMIPKFDFKYIGFVGFPEAIVSLENTSYPVKKAKINFDSTYAISNEILERVCEVEIHKGGVLCIQSKEQE